ncbi:hypothetical protein L211DRAFT_777062 [Terfezia boudieri ATCC MYA-4762]|uniref:Ubiquitin 3 binding protein But2 C-terminal domain-containing protein n=1 Tax=Terfezia boudieri ATCC MYA-4762 TaxID=1051890 RepID=A0A3N4M1U0_9PEZI|nr:hypothetical protein L211DRAFT_777062 [Terfezia boudieri ATCC MYA-4762]
MHALPTRLLALTAFILGIVASPVSHHPDWSKVFIKLLPTSGFGSGCPPPDSVNPTLGPNGAWLNLAFYKYFAEVYPGSKPSENYKNCQLQFEVHFPPGWSLTLFKTTFTGRFTLDEGVNATQEATYHFGGNPQATATFICDGDSMGPWTGPRKGRYSCLDELLVGKYIWSSCKGTFETLFIETSIELDNSDNKGGSGFINTESSETATQQFELLWKPC